MKIAIIIGTRPEIIKMAPVMDEIERRGIEYILIHTGQHYDHEMSEKFFLDLELKKPDYNIGVGSGTHGKQTATMISHIEDVLSDEKPDIVLVQGDTNAVLAGAIAASKLQIAVGHVEAGLRSFDKTMPEELNRQIADNCSTMYFVPTEESGLNLLFENINPHEIFITGNTVVDACVRNIEIAEKSSSIMSELDLDGNTLVLTLHRAENVDDQDRLENIVEALLEMDEVTVIFPVHPRTVKTLKNFGLYSDLDEAEHIKLVKPVGYLDFLLILSKSRFVMTDSGGIQEEAITFNVPCMTLRYNTERPETVKAGGNILVGAKKEDILHTYNRLLADENLYSRMKNASNPYGDGTASIEILKAITDEYNRGNLKITAPDEVKGNPVRELLQIKGDQTVSEYEESHPDSTVNMVFETNEPLFPYPDLKLKNRLVLLTNFIK